MNGNGERQGLVRRIWQRATLAQRLALLTLTPAALTALALVALLAHRQTETVRAITFANADAIAIQTAAIAFQPLRDHNLDALRRIARSTSQLPNVVGVRFSFANRDVAAVVKAPTHTAGKRLISAIRPVIDPQSNVLGYVLIVVSRAQAVAMQEAAIRGAMIILAVALVLIMLVSWQVAHWTSQPLRKLADAAHRLSQGEYDVEVKVTDATEIGELQRGFNAATTALLGMQLELQNRIDAATQELASKNVALEKAGIAKAQFFARAAHDLRQPLYALTLFSSTLANGEHDPVRLDRITRIHECVVSLDRLCVELLDLSRLETGAMQPEWRSFPLDGLFDELSRNFRAFAEQRGLRLIVRKTTLAVRSDRTMLGRILGNLVSNALRYTREGGVLVGARLRGGKVRIDVWDTGRGIAPKYQKRIFEEFYRIERQLEPRSSPVRGLGLGLSTVRALGDLLGTPVTLLSRPGRGSLFTLSVPARTLEVPPPPAVVAPPLDVAGLRVLVIDDDTTILSAVTDLLESWGCQVRTAEDREQSLIAARQWQQAPDLVISDLRLRDNRSGLEALAALDRHYGSAGKATFARLLITGETRADRLREIVAARIPVLHKPVTPEQLRECIVATCSGFRASGDGKPEKWHAGHGPPAEHATGGEPLATS